MQVLPPTGLLEKILKRIHHEERVLATRRVIIFSATTLVSLPALILSAKMLLSDLAQSGFLNFFSLLFSDFSSVLAAWQSFSLILLETLPAISLTLVLAVILGLLQSIKSLRKNFKNIKSMRQLAVS